MNRSSLLGAAALAVVVVAGLGVALLREDATSRGGGGKNGTPRAWTARPLALDRPATPTQPAKVELPKLPARDDAIAGIVKDVRGAAVGGATVALLADEKCSVTCAADGSFSLAPSLGGKKLILRVEGPAPLAARVVAGVAPGTKGLVIVLRSGEAISGRVVRAKDRSPVPGAKVEASNGDWLGRAVSDVSGSFTLQGAPPGALGLVVSAEGLIPRVVTVTAREVEVALASGTRLEGTVVASGSPVSGAKVILHERGVPLSFERREVASDAKGHFAFDGVPAAELRVHARTASAVSAIAIVRADGAHDPEPLRLELANGALEGQVSCGGAPVVGAQLSLEDEGSMLRATSDARGRFELAPVPPSGELALRVEAKGFATRRVKVNAAQTADIELTRSAVLAITTSPPAQEIEIEGPQNERRLLQWGGLLDDLAAGSTWIVAHQPGRAPTSRRVELREGETTRIDITLDGGAALDGICVGDDGAPVGGAALVATDPDAGPLGGALTATSGADGRFTIADMGPGKHRVFASAPGYLEAQADLDPGARSVTLTLGRSYALEVQVTLPPLEAKLSREHAKRLGDVLVRLAGTPEQRVVTGDGGRASAVFERLRGQSYRVEVFSPGLSPASAEVDPRSTSVVTLTLEKGAEATGTVVDPDGKPLPGAAISRGHDPNEDLANEGAFATLLAMTEAQGEFEVDVAPAGEEVTVTHPDFAPLVTRLSPGAKQKLTLSAGSRIVGRTRPNLGVSLEGPVSKRTTSAADGSFTFKGLLAGTYHVKRHDTKPEDLGVEVTVGNRGEVSVDLR